MYVCAHVCLMLINKEHHTTKQRQCSHLLFLLLCTLLLHFFAPINQFSEYGDWKQAPKYLRVDNCLIGSGEFQSVLALNIS